LKQCPAHQRQSCDGLPHSVIGHGKQVFEADRAISEWTRAQLGARVARPGAR
jgi:hypothetical protein